MHHQPAGQGLESPRRVKQFEGESQPANCPADQHGGEEVQRAVLPASASVERPLEGDDEEADEIRMDDLANRRIMAGALLAGEGIGKRHVGWICGRFGWVHFSHKQSWDNLSFIHFYYLENICLHLVHHAKRAI